MAANKRTRRKYRPPATLGTPVNLRWAVDERRKAYMDAAPWQALDALTAPDASSEHVATLVSAMLLLRQLLADIGEPTDEALAASAAGCIAIAQVQERDERTGRVGVTGEELQALRWAMGYLDVALRECTRRQQRDALLKMLNSRVLIDPAGGAVHAA